MSWYEHFILISKLYPDQKHLDKVSPQEYHNRCQEYRDSIGLGEGIKNFDGFAKWNENKVTGITDFLETKQADGKSQEFKLPDGTSLAKKLEANTPATQRITTAFQNAMSTSDTTKKAQKDYEESVRELNKLIKADPPEVKLGDVAAYMLELKGEAKKAIDAQHKLEKDNLDQLFTQASFVNDLKAAFNLTTDAQVKKIQQEMTAQLSSRQNESLKNFENQINEEANKLQRLQQSERDRIGYLATMYQLNEAMRNEIIRLAELEAQKNNTHIPTAAEINFDPQKGLAILKNIKVSDMKVFETFTGRTITRQGDTFSIKFPNRFFSKAFDSKMALKDMTSMACAIRACGNTKITMNVTYAGRTSEKAEDDPHAMELGRQAYEACVLAGFSTEGVDDPDNKGKKKYNITIRVNGVEKSADELFHGQSNRLQAILEKARQAEKERENYIKNFDSSKASQADLKQKIKTGRDAEAAAQQQPAPADMDLGGAIMPPVA